MDIDIHAAMDWLMKLPEQWRWLAGSVILFGLLVFSDGIRAFLGYIILTCLWIGTFLPVVWWIRDEFFDPRRNYSLHELFWRGCGWVYVPGWLLCFGSFLIGWRQAIKTRKQIQRSLEFDPEPVHGADFADDEDLKRGGLF